MAALNVSNSDKFFPNSVIDKHYKTCIAYKSAVPHDDRGVFHGEDFVGARVLPVFMLQVALAFCISQIIYFVLRPLKQSKVVCTVLSGIILGPSVLGRNRKLWEKLFPPEEMVVVNTAAIIGGIYFVFLVSIKMDRARILKRAIKTWKISLLSLLVPFTITMFLVRLLHSYIPGVKKGLFHYFISFMLSQTFFSVVAHAVTELKLLNSELGQLALSSAIFGEFFSWYNLTVATFVHKGIEELIKSQLSLCVVISFLIFIVRPAVRWIIRKTPEGEPVEQIYIIAILLLPLIIGVLSEILGSTFISGALVTGLFIPTGPPLGAALVEKSEIVISNIFLPFFYIRIGQLTNIYSITDWTEFFVLEMILIAGYIAKVAASLLSLLFFKMTLRNAILFSFIFNIKGIVELLVALLWRLGKYVDEQTFTILVLSHTVVTAIVTPLISIYYKPQERLEAAATTEQFARTLQTTPLDGEFRIICCIHFEENVPGINALLQASSSDEMSPICAHVIHLVDLVGSATPVLEPYNNQRRKLKENSTDRIMRAVTKHMQNSGVSMTIRPLRMIAPYDTMHETICRLARDTCVPFILLPFHKTQEIHERTASLQQFNLKIQKYAPCTVGILVDKGLPRFSSSTHFYYNVAIFFLGGPDDREVLALATRMSGHPGVTITLFRIDITREEAAHNEVEKLLDDIAVNEFKAKSICNSCVVCRELAVNEPTQLVDTFRSIENNYDLVMAGKRQELSPTFEVELKPWVEYEELGIIGDMFASSDCGGITSVLVIQCVGSVEGDLVSIAHERTSRFSSSSKLCDREDDNVVDTDQVDENTDPTICTKV